MKQVAQLKLTFRENAFVDSLCEELMIAGVRPIDAIEKLISEHLILSAENVPPVILLSMSVHVFATYNPNRCPTLPQLVDHGYKTWYSEIRFVTHPSILLGDITYDMLGIVLDEIDFGSGIRRAYQLKSKKLKTLTNHTLRLNTLRIENRVFKRVLSKLGDAIVEQPLIPNPTSWIRDYGRNLRPLVFNLVSFNHIVTGDRLYCSCAMAAHTKDTATCSF